MSHFSSEHIVMYLNGRETPAVFVRVVKCIAEGEKEKIGLTHSVTAHMYFLIAIYYKLKSHTHKDFFPV